MVIEFRELTKEEESIFKESLDYWLTDTTLIENFKFIIGEGNWKEVFVATDEVIESLSKYSQITPYSTGLGIGEIKEGKFLLSLSGGSFISKYTNKKVVVNKEAEQLFLYKRNILGKSIHKIHESIEEKDKFLVFSKNNDYLGIGQLLVDKSLLTKLEFSEKNVIKNIIDLGWYLRKGK